MKKGLTNDKSPNDGHRERLREKFVQSGLDGFADYEIVELLLTFGTPRRDTKQAAKAAIKRFGSLRGVLDAPVKELENVPGIGRVSAIALSMVQQVARAYLKDSITEPDSVKSSQAVFDYLKHSMRDLDKEIFKVLFLDSQNHILAVDDISKGTVNSSPVAPREVIESALNYKSVSLIFVHNHPSGDPAPSPSDKDLTRDLIFAANTVGLKVLDHIIVGNDKYYSFAGTGLIEEYELSFVNAKATHRNRKTPTPSLNSDGLPWSKP